MGKFSAFVSLVTFSFILLATIPCQAESSLTLKKPPASLSKWYKPENKRQVWLHTMFRLRRAMQAIDYYAQQNNQQAMQKWSEKLKQDYLEIAEMVPEWKNEIKPRLLPELDMFIENADNRRVTATLNMIQRTCNDCHEQYQAVVTAFYRSPSYEDISIKSSEGKKSSFEDEMETLSTSVNQVLIALEDSQPAVAHQASLDLARQLDNLGFSCQQCHKNDPAPAERILGRATREKLDQLQSAIKNNQVKDSQKLMGEIGVSVCARCHNTHRILGDLREALLHKTN